MSGGAPNDALEPTCRRLTAWLVGLVAREVFAKARAHQRYELGRREQTMPEPRALPKKASHVAG